MQAAVFGSSRLCSRGRWVATTGARGKRSMFDQIEDILAQLSAGEDSLSEFKELRIEQGAVTVPNAESFAGEMVAFANADGGGLFLGVTDSGAVQGLPDDAIGTVESWVVNIAPSNCDPPIRPVIRRLRLPDPSGTPKA